MHDGVRARHERRVRGPSLRAPARNTEERLAELCPALRPDETSLSQCVSWRARRNMIAAVVDEEFMMTQDIGTPADPYAASRTIMCNVDAP